MKSSVPLGNGHLGMEALRSPHGKRDVEAADFDENELDDLHGRPRPNGIASDLDAERYSLGSDSDEDGRDSVGRKEGKGRVDLSD